jgi:hypothetical protein
MKRWIIGKQKHFAILAVLLVYLFAANPIYTHFFLKNGKPVSSNVALPAPSSTMVYNSRIVFKLADMQPVRIDGQNLYQIRGFAFEASNPVKENKISIVLSTKNQNQVFPTSTVPHPNMIQSYSGYTKGMDHDEFSMLLSDAVLKPGTYQVGILLEEIGGSTRSYVRTGSVIKKTPNTIKYIPAP